MFSINEYIDGKYARLILATPETDCHEWHFCNTDFGEYEEMAWFVVGYYPCNYPSFAMSVLTPDEHISALASVLQEGWEILQIDDEIMLDLVDIASKYEEHSFIVSIADYLTQSSPTGFSGSKEVTLKNVSKILEKGKSK